jgi:hypothetical protein
LHQMLYDSTRQSEDGRGDRTYVWITKSISSIANEMRRCSFKASLDKNVVTVSCGGSEIVTLINISISYRLMAAHFQVVALHGTSSTPICPIGEGVNKPDYQTKVLQ